MKNSLSFLIYETWIIVLLFPSTSGLHLIPKLCLESLNLPNF